MSSNNKTKSFDYGAFIKMVAALVVPMALQNLINVGISSVDVIMLGKVSETVLSGASLGNQVYFILNLILFGLSSGASVLVAQYWGKKDMESIETVFGMAMKISCLVGALFTVVTFFFPTELMHIFSNEADVINEGAKYLRIVCLSYVISAITMVYLNTMRCVEKVMIATWTYLLSMITNIVINGILIFGLFGFPRLEVEGAAIGTVIARLAELTLVIIYNIFVNKTLPFKFSILFKKNKLLAKDFLKYSSPVILNELMWGLGISAVAAIIGHMGKSAVSANSVVQVTRQLAMVVAFGVSSATAIILGKSIGEGKTDEAKTYGDKFVLLSILTGLAGSVIILIVRPIAISVMSITPEAKELLSYMMLIMCVYVVCQSLNTTLIVGVFRSGGDTVFGLIADLVFLWGVSIFTGFLAAFVFKLDIHLVYLFLVADEVCKIPFTVARYKSYKWLKNITR